VEEALQFMTTSDLTVSTRTLLCSRTVSDQAFCWYNTLKAEKGILVLIRGNALFTSYSDTSYRVSADKQLQGGG